MVHISSNFSTISHNYCTKHRFSLTSKTLTENSLIYAPARSVLKAAVALMPRTGSSKVLLLLPIPSPSATRTFRQPVFFVLVFLLWLLIPLVPLVMFLFLFQVILLRTFALAKTSSVRSFQGTTWSIEHLKIFLIVQDSTMTMSQGIA